MRFNENKWSVVTWNHVERVPRGANVQTCLHSEKRSCVRVKVGKVADVDHIVVFISYLAKFAFSNVLL